LLEYADDRPPNPLVQSKGLNPFARFRQITPLLDTDERSSIAGNTM